MKITNNLSRRVRLVSLISGFSVLLHGCIDFGDSSQSEDSKASINLLPAENDQALRRYLTEGYLKIQESPDTYEYAEDDSTSGTTAELFSQTNVVVNGVDESDVWKYDGEHFFVVKPATWEYLTTDDCDVGINASGESKALRDYMPCGMTPKKTENAELRIVKNNQQQTALLSFTEFEPSKLYLHDDQAWLLGNKNAISPDVYYGPYWHSGQTDIKVVDVQSKDEPEEISHISLDGHLIETRRIDDELLFISRFTPYIEGLHLYPTTRESVRQNKQRLASLATSDLLPQITINGQVKPLVTSSDCYLEQKPETQWGAHSLVVVTRLDMKTNTFQSRCVAGDVSGIYASQENLYLLNNTYWAYTDDEVGIEPDTGRTHVHQYALNDDFTYQGSALVLGWLGGGSSSFRLGELADGNLALVTNVGNWGNPNHRLTVLKTNNGSLETVATLPNSQRPQAIGKPGEQIYSVRFMQNRAYIVTFQKVDPLYVIDLSNSEDPFIAGELEIPGFSDYLHPVGDNLLIGIGKDAKQGNSGTTWFQGIKVALFDVSDMNQPEEVNSFILGKRGSHTALAYEHHAFSGLQMDDQYRFAFPVSINDGNARGQYWQDPESQYYEWSYAGLQMFEIKDGQMTNAGVLKTEENTGEQSYESWGIRRGLIQQDTVYHLSGSDLYKATWGQPDTLSNKF